MPNDCVALELLLQSLAGGRRVAFRLKGNSLNPLMQPGDVLLVEQADAEHLEPGEIVLFRTEEGFTAHRILRTRRSGGGFWLQTAAERAQVPDPWIPGAKVIGRAAEIRPACDAGRQRAMPSGWRRRLWSWRTRTRCLLYRARTAFNRSACR